MKTRRVVPTLAVLALLAFLAAPLAGDEGVPPRPELSARKLAAALTDGNEHVVANNLIVDRLVALGARSILPLVQCVNDPEFEGRGYATWALAKVVLATKTDPAMVVPAIEAAAACGDPIVRALALSALRQLRNRPAAPALSTLRRIGSRATMPARMATGLRLRSPTGANPHVLAALRDAPPPTAPIAELVKRLGERKGHWREIVLDRLIARGAESADALRAAARDPEHVGRAYALWGLGRLHRVLGNEPADLPEVVETLEAACGAKDEEVARYARAGLTALRQEAPLDADGIRDADPATIVAAFRGGDGAVRANNVLVDRLLLHGEAALPALLRAARDPANPGRGYADWAMAKILRATGARPPEIVEHLRGRYRPGTSPISILGM